MIFVLWVLAIIGMHEYVNCVGDKYDIYNLLVYHICIWSSYFPKNSSRESFQSMEWSRTHKVIRGEVS